MKDNAFDPNRTILNLISYLKESPSPKIRKSSQSQSSDDSPKNVENQQTLRLSLEPPQKDLLEPHKNKLIRMLQKDIQTEFNQRSYSHALNGRQWADPAKPVSIGEKNKMRMRAYQK